jgi:hypothetical protein
MRVPISARSVVAALLLVFATVGITIVLTDDGNGGRTVTVHVGQAPAPVAVSVDGPDADTKRDDTLTLSSSAKAVYRSAPTIAPDVVGNMRGPDPTAAGVVRGPLAAQEWPGCKTAFVRAFSQRTSSIRAIALHFTAGPNITGWGDVDGLTGFSNNTANQVSWHFAIDREGHCAYNVPIQQKAWTIAGLNSQTVNLEIVGTGHDVNYAGAGLKKVAAVVGRIGRIEHIPLSLGATDGNCNVTRRGIITHWMGGPCSGGHVDIRPYSITGVIGQIRRLQVSSLDRLRCSRLNAWRAAGRPLAGTHAAVLRKHTLEAHHVTCLPGKAATR